MTYKTNYNYGLLRKKPVYYIVGPGMNGAKRETIPMNEPVIRIRKERSYRMNNHYSCVRIVIISIFLILASGNAFSQTSDFYGGITDLFSIFSDPNTGLTLFPTLLIPAGGLYEGMGTAFTAVSSDSGFLDSNPAGSAMLTYSELSLLHHNWIADSNIEGVIYALRINDLGLGFGGNSSTSPSPSTIAWATGARAGISPNPWER